MKKLKPPKNYRYLYNRRACSNCKYWNMDKTKEFYECERDPANIAGEWGDINPEFRICDGHKWQQ